MMLAERLRSSQQTPTTQKLHGKRQSPDMIILQYLSENLLKDWYELGELNDGLTARATSQGLDLQGRMTRDRFGKRLAALRVSEETKRATQDGRKVTLYHIDPEVLSKKLENHLRG